MTIFYICDRKRKTDHCHEHCFCGRPHRPEGCTKPEVCDIGSKKGTVVQCRPLNKKEMKLYERYINMLLDSS